ncbi:MAG TPA: DUF2272 domain-containing protein [Gammaproteobacteria bacterium]|nr:DUF2272 domain-containing protein [Gammaproteobacteria bacterium]
MTGHRTLLLMLAAALTATLARAQPAPFERLPADVLDALPPSARVSGSPGRIAVENEVCHSRPREQLRRRIVDIAIQEWAYFGFTIIDEASSDFEDRPRRRDEPRRRWVDPRESARVVHSIAGYWTVTPDGAWILDRQNRIWRASGDELERWRDPWSAAFISWVMCESGLSSTADFQRAVAHYVYIDQAIEARDRPQADAAFIAYEVGEQAVEPGDLLCRGRRGAYRTLAERRDDLGDGARSHCDIVVKLDPGNDRIHVIGGNVRGSVRLKFLPAAVAPDGGAGEYATIGRGSRIVFAHLKLQAPSIDARAVETSPTIRTLSRDPDTLRALEQHLADGGAPSSLSWPLPAHSAQPTPVKSQPAG